MKKKQITLLFKDNQNIVRNIHGNVEVNKTSRIARSAGYE